MKLELEISLNEKDYWTFNNFICNQLLKKTGYIWIRYIYTILIWLSVFLLTIFIYTHIKKFHAPYHIIIIACFILLFSINILEKFLTKKVFTPDDDGFVLGEHKMSFSDSGIENESKNSTSRLSWSAVKEIINSKDYIYLMLDKNVAYIIPKRLFDSSEDIEAFLDTIKGYWENATSNK